MLGSLPAAPAQPRPERVGPGYADRTGRYHTDRPAASLMTSRPLPATPGASPGGNIFRPPALILVIIAMLRPDLCGNDGRQGEFAGPKRQAVMHQVNVHHTRHALLILTPTKRPL